jgi:hypothetical protein
MCGCGRSNTAPLVAPTAFTPNTTYAPPTHQPAYHAPQQVDESTQKLLDALRNSANKPAVATKRPPGYTKN